MIDIGIGISILMCESISIVGRCGRASLNAASSEVSLCHDGAKAMATVIL